MKKTPALLALLLSATMASAQELPAPSPAATVTQRIGLTDVTVKYSRPSAKGRTVFKDLVPFGELWRTGANGATIISTTGPLLINGEKLPQGEYAVFTIPGEGAWQIIFSKQTDLWGTDGYDQTNDALRTKAQWRENSMTETFTIGFENLGVDEAELVLSWEKGEAFVTLKADAFGRSMENINRALADPKADFRTYYRASAFCQERGVEPKSALMWAQKSVELEKKYWNTFNLAKAQAAVSMFAEAAATGKEAIALAVAEKDNGAQRAYQQKVDEWQAKAGGK